MSLKKIFLATTLALSSSLAAAGNVSYDYIDLGYLDYDSADGFNVEFSTEFSEDFYGRIDYSDLNADFDGLDLSMTRLNFGYKTAFSSSTDFIAELGYEKIESDLGSFLGSSDDDGFNVRVGLRGMAAKNFELGGFVSYSDALESTDVTVEGRYHFTPAFSMALELGNDEEFDEHYGVSLRFNF